VQVYHPAHRCIRYAVVTGECGVTPGWSAQLVNRSDVNVSEWLIWVVACGWCWTILTAPSPYVRKPRRCAKILNF